MIIFEDGAKIDLVQEAYIRVQRNGENAYRDALALTVRATHEQAAERFVDGAKYGNKVEYEGGESDLFDFSEYCLAGDITDHRDGTLTVHMHKETDAEKEIKQLDAVKEAAAVACAFLTDEQALSVPIIFPLWSSDDTYKTGDRVRFGGKLYKCLQPHNAQSNWTPEAAPSLWTRIDDPAEEWPAWVQPQSTNPYAKGAKVTHKGKKWTSAADGNVWEPGVYGWSEVA